MSDLRTLCLDDFQPHKGTSFRVTVEDGTIEATLIDVIGNRGDTVSETDRSPFSAVFRLAEDTPPVQQIYRLEHAVMGPLDLFLVPIGPDDDGMRFEAVFS